MLNDKQKEQVRKVLSGMKHPVEVVFFGQENACESCDAAYGIFAAVAELSDRIRLTRKDFVVDAAEAERYGVDKIPAAVVLGERDYGIRVFGVPAGYEFASLLEALVLVGSRDSGLPPPVREALAAVKSPVHLQVMVTLTCPYCPRAVNLAHRFAMESEQVRADMVEMSQFPHLAVRYDVQGVPVTIINEGHQAMGAVPAQHLLEQVLHALEHPEGHHHHPPA